ncbi:unnamed protein product [Echinostoma caproni]|uniref:PPM-type phosphatase domain-containing protein n=1 Tax=Echinostoma caproni TaxID=27848 RepID=A0A183BGP6_9TREM|nr:unnamed protein product [Echinostoma caproni]
MSSALVPASPDAGANYGIALVDRLTKSTLGIPTTDTDLQPEKLKENFGVALHELYLLKAKLQDKTSSLESPLYVYTIEDESCHPIIAASGDPFVIVPEDGAGRG